MATTAEIYAQAKKDAAANELNSMYGNLENAYNQQVNAANLSAQSSLDQLTQAAQNYQQNFENNARSAYVNKMQGEMGVANELSRLGLQNSGYGVTQRLGNEAAYGENLANLQKGLATDLSNLDLKRADVNANLAQTLANLGSNYASNVNSTSQYIANYLQNTYDKAYAQKYQEEQDALANQIASSRSYSSSRSSSSGSKTSTTPLDKEASKYMNPYTGATQNLAAIKNYGVFDNGYQPKGISGYGKVSDTKQTVAQVLGSGYTGSTGVPLDNQKVWQTPDGSYWVWDGSVDDYMNITSIAKGSVKESTNNKSNALLAALAGASAAGNIK